MSERDLILNIIDNNASLPYGTIAWEAPSNIALVKYWGKKPGQIPVNPSLSFSLQHCLTRTEVTFTEKRAKSKKPEIGYTFNNRPTKAFSTRIENYFHSILTEIPWVTELRLKINSYNTFPDSAGIASSASAFASLALVLAQYEYTLIEKAPDAAMFQRASHLARLGSGSAARSVYGGWASWGLAAHLPDASDEFAIPFTEVHPAFKGLNDAILIVSSEKKAVSSSKGHALMDTNPFKSMRITQAGNNHSKMLEILKNGDLMAFIELAENEAMTLHAMMMTSNPGYILLKPGSLPIIHAVRAFREKTGLPVGFTIDAGPNIHLLYFNEDKERIVPFIKNELIAFCEDSHWINDGIGQGPLLLNHTFQVE